MSVIRSPYSEQQVPDVPIHTLLLSRFSAYGDKIALIDGVTGKEYSYSHLTDIFQRVASGLAKLGLRKGDILSVYSHNTVEFVFIYWGTLCAGGTVTTVNPTYTKYELVQHLKHSGAKFVFSTSQNLQTCREACEDIRTVKKLICADIHATGCVPFDTLLNDDGSLWPQLQQLRFNIKDDVAAIPYSSGTTGLPKGVLLTHYNMVSVMAQVSHPDIMNPKKMEEFLSGQQDVVIAVLPFYHVAGMMGIMTFRLIGGSKLVILPKFEPKSFLSAIEKYKVSNLPLVPPIVLFLAKSPLVLEYDLSSVKIVNCGAAPLSKEVEQELHKRVKVPEMKQGYGMTETTVVITVFSPFESPRPGSCGLLVPGCQAKVVDISTGKLLGPNERGEIWVKGSQIMKGYLNDPKATAEILDTEGFLHTGDIGYYDADGYFYIVDRMKELIKVKGSQVAPAELEAELLTHPKVGDVGVVGIPDERTGELPRAYIVKKPGISVTEQELQDFVKERLAPYKQLTGGIQFITDIPRLPSGKIIRRKLREMVTKSRI